MQKEKRNCEELWRLYEPYIRKLCEYKLNSRPEYIDDCVQEVFLALAAETGEIEYPKAWLTKVAQNKIKDIYERASREQKLFVPLENGENSGYEDEITVSDERLEEVKAVVLGELTETERQLLKEYYTDRLKIKQIAKMHGTTESNIKQQLFRLRKKVVYLTRRHLAQET